MAWYHNGRKYWYHNGKRYSKRMNYRRNYYKRYSGNKRKKSSWLSFKIPKFKSKLYEFIDRDKGIKKKTISGGTYYEKNGKGYYYDEYGKHEFDLDTLPGPKGEPDNIDLEYGTRTYQDMNY